MKGLNLDFNDLLRVFWQRKLLILVVTLAVVGPAYAGTKLVTPEYESTSTMALSPKGGLNTEFLSFFGVLDVIVPLYADAADSRPTRLAARAEVGRPLAGFTVETFKGTPILKIKARSTSRTLARDTAAAVTSALLSRAQRGEIGDIKSLKLYELDPAAIPGTPVFPRTRLTLFVAGLLGLALGFGAALLRENLTTRIETADDLARVTGLPVFAEIPAESAIAKLRSPDDLMRNPRLRIVAEALRDLRTNLLFSDDSIRSLVITSPDGSHGKTTVSFGLAATLARAGTPTLLVDGDLRRGRIAQLLGIERTPGLMDVLLEEVPIEDAIHATSLETLDVLPGGRRAGDPGELLTVEFTTILSKLEKQYEAVIIDSTPVLPISDARVMARYADATILVARAGHARRRQVRSAIEKLQLISVEPAAVVLNYSQSVRGSSYYVQPTGEGAERLQARRMSRTRGAASR